MMRYGLKGSFVGALAALLLSGCASGPDTCEGGTPCHPTFAKRAYNRPYKIKGTWHYPQGHYEYAQTGVASYYGGTDVFHGRPTSNGDIFDKNKVSAAHKTLPIPCVVRVTNLKNGRSITMPVNDRGPFKHERIIDLSLRAAQLLGFERQGLAQVRVETCVEESLQAAHEKASRVKKKSSTKAPARKAMPAVQKKPSQSTTPKFSPQIVLEKEGAFIEASPPMDMATARARAGIYLEKYPQIGVSLAPTPSKHYKVLLGPMDSSKDAYNLLNLLKGVKG